MSAYESGFADQLDAFARYRKASGSWNEHASAENLRFFDRHCASVDPSSPELTQEMLDGWCAMRETESPRSCYTLNFQQKCDSRPYSSPHEAFTMARISS